jgi:transcriptional regulator with XRE-family HTH domain
VLTDTELQSRVLGAIIQGFRRRQDMTVDEAALRAGISNCAWSFTEKGKTSPTWATLSAIVLKGLGMSMEKFGRAYDRALREARLVKPNGKGVEDYERRIGFRAFLALPNYR